MTIHIFGHHHGCRSKSIMGIDDPSLVHQVRGMDPFSKYERVPIETGGAFTVVKAKYGADGRHYSLKSIKVKTRNIFDKKERDLCQRQQEEARLSLHSLKQIDHPNIIKLVDIMEYGSKLYLVEELHFGSHWRPLSDFRGHLGEDGVCSAAKQLLSAVNYLEQKHFMHGRMTLEGIMVDTDKAFLVITDFLGTFSQRDLQVEMVSDIYSVGAIAYELVTSETLKGYSVNHKLPAYQKLSKPAQSCIKSMILNQALGPRQALDHPWIHERGGENFLKHFNRVTKAFTQSAKSAELKRAAMNVIAHNSASDDIAHLLQAFREFDEDDNGTISLREFHLIMDKIAAKKLPQKEIDKIYAGLDVDGDGTMSYTEFVAGAMEYKGQIEEWRIREAFLNMDRDNSGYITHEELRTIFASSEEDAQRMIDEADANKDGQISYQEFLRAFSDEQERVMKKVMKKTRVRRSKAT